MSFFSYFLINCTFLLWPSAAIHASTFVLRRRIKLNFASYFVLIVGFVAFVFFNVFLRLDRRFDN